MTTFTMQDLNNSNNINDTPTPEEEEAMKTLFEQMGKDLTQATPIPSAPEPQPSTTPAGTNVPTIESVIDAISSQLRLLATVISQSQAQGNSLNAEDQSLQECVGLVLKQSEWFKEMVEKAIDERDLDELAHDAVKDCVETEVEYYFNHSFSPEDHFDFGDAVSDAVDDRLDDIVADKIDDVVQEKFDEFIENATISISR